MVSLDDDAVIATVDLVGRSGAREVQIGYLNDEPPHRWYAHAQYRGARITAEDHAGPVEAAEALARRLLTGALCTHCKGLIALSDTGAVFYPNSISPVPGYEPIAEDQARSRKQCRYRRVGKRWVRGCEDLTAGRRPKRPKPTKNRRRR